MLTIFSSLKPNWVPFANDVQCNAIQSWQALNITKEIILLGNHPGMAEIAAQYGLRHEPDVPYRDNRPLVGPVFARAQKLATFDTLMYINSDIMLLSDFVPTLCKVVEYGRSSGKPFMAVGGRYDLELKARLNFDTPDWEAVLREDVKRRGRLLSREGTDYFIFNKGPWPGDIPEFVLGANRFDKWLIYSARAMGMDVIDVTAGIIAVQHEYEDRNSAAYLFERVTGPAARRQYNLVKKPEYFFTLDDTNMEYTGGEVRKRPFRWRGVCRFMIRTGPMLYPQYRAVFLIFLIAEYLLRLPRSLAGKVKRFIIHFVQPA